MNSEGESLNPSLYPGRWWEPAGDGRFRCELCPRECTLKPGQRGFCYIRQATESGIALTSFGRSSGFCIDPIEKKPLNHFYPGTSVLSFGTAGCNLGCRFCQNWDISKVRSFDRLQSEASPERIAEAALEEGCRSVAFTYNDPVIFAEYAIETARACRARGVKTVAVSAGYITERARGDFFSAMDAANIDLKGFTEDFYGKYSLARLEPVLETLKYIVHKTSTWLEVTTLLIPGANDSAEEIDRMTSWIRAELGCDVPLHFTAFHPDFKMRDVGPTPLSTLRRAREIALSKGLRYVYTGNVNDPEGAATYCPGCHGPVIRRSGYDLDEFAIRDGACAACGTRIAGHFEMRPGQWGSRRRAVTL